MAVRSAAVPEKLYQCEVKRRRLRADGPGYEPFWKIKSVDDALGDGDTEFRCKDCHGSVKLKKRGAGTSSHVEHIHKSDADYCMGGLAFQAATDQRQPRLSSAPVN